jgi:hypothetical protein
VESLSGVSRFRRMNLAANVIALAHAIFSLFVALGFVAIVLGWLFGTQWPNARFRIVHLIAVLLLLVRVVLQVPCPFSWLEDVTRDSIDTMAAPGLQRFLHALAFRGADQKTFTFGVWWMSIASALICLHFFLRNLVHSFRQRAKPPIHDSYFLR